MLSRSLLAEAVTLASGRVELAASSVQRKLRVGYVTAAQLVEALEDAGVLGEWNRDGKRPVLVADAEKANAMVAGAIDAGRIVLT